MAKKSLRKAENLQNQISFNYPLTPLLDNRAHKTISVKGYQTGVDLVR